MNALRLLVAASVLMCLAGCATQGPRPESQSILEVLDEAASAPVSSSQPPRCAGNEVTYCEIDVGARHCGCRDQAEVSRALASMYGSR